MNEYKKTQEAEREFMKNIQDKYGIGTLNVSGGEFIPETPAKETPTDTTNS